MPIFILKGYYWNKIQHENEFFMVVYPVWSKPDNWVLKQCHKFTVMAHSSSGARLTKAYDVTIQRYRNLHAKIEDSKIHILRCMGSKFCVKFQRFPLKFHTKF